MKTLYYSHPACLLHEPNPEHPESPDRLTAIEGAIQAAVADKRLQGIEFCGHDVLPATPADLRLAHTQAHIDHVFATIPQRGAVRGLALLDGDTVVCPESLDASLYAASLVLAAVEAVIKGAGTTGGVNAFCAVRPPGHHAHRGHSAGFCIFNNIAIAALAAIERHGLKRVAILDFDVHHGDGTMDIVKDNPNIFFASSYQSPLYASTPMTEFQTGVNHTVLNKPFASGTAGKAIVQVWKRDILPKVEAFQPEMIFVSAGFDGHIDDPLAGLNFLNADYGDLMQAICDMAEKTCQGRVVVSLEGGYNLKALSNSVLACLNAMQGNT